MVTKRFRHDDYQPTYLTIEPKSNGCMASVASGAPHDQWIDAIHTSDCKIVAAFDVGSRDVGCAGWALTFNHCPLQLLGKELHVGIGLLRKPIASGDQCMQVVPQRKRCVTRTIPFHGLMKSETVLATLMAVPSSPRGNRKMNIPCCDTSWYSY
jgi:hypothetical protein